MINLYDNVDDYNDNDGIDQDLEFSGNTDNFDNSAGDKWGNINNKLYSNNQPSEPGGYTGINWSVARRPNVMCYSEVGGIWAQGDDRAIRYSTDGLGTVLQTINTSTNNVANAASISEYGNPPSSTVSRIAVRDGGSSIMVLYNNSTNVFAGNYSLTPSNTRGSEYKAETMYTVDATGTVRRFVGTNQTDNLNFSTLTEIPTNRSYGLAKVADGYIIADRTAKTFFKYDNSGVYTGTSKLFGDTVAGAIFDICSDEDDFLYVGDTTNDIIYKFYPL